MKKLELMMWIGIPLISLVIVICVMGSPFNCDGEMRWEKYTGELKQLEIRCTICCHVNSFFQIDDEHVPVMNCEESLLLIKLNKNYTIYCEPASEEYAITPDFGEPTCYWSIRIYKIENEYGYPIWGER